MDSDNDSSHASNPGSECSVTRHRFHEQFGSFRKNGHSHPSFPVSGIDGKHTPEEFLRAAERACGEPDQEQVDDDRLDAAKELLGALARLCVPVRGDKLTGRQVIYHAGSRLVTLLSRVRPDLLPASIRSEVQIAKAARVTRAAISRRITVAGDSLGIHLGHRRPSARAKFRQIQRDLYASGKRLPRQAKPPSKRT